MSTQLSDQDILENAPNAKIFDRPMRVVALDVPNDQVWLSELRRQNSAKPSRMKTYFRAPRAFTLSEVRNQVEDFKLIKAKAGGRELLDTPDDAIISAAQTGRERRQFEKMIRDRNRRWTDLSPVLSGSIDSNKPRTFLQMMADPQLPKQIADRAAELGKAPSTLYSLLHQYWAMGSRKNSLCTNLCRCGCPGQAKPQSLKLGRTSRLHKAGLAGPGFTLTDEEKKKLGWGYTLISKTVPAKDAFHLASGAFWADREVDSNGRETAVLWPKDRRPTFGQFMYWGRKLNKEKSVRRMVLGEAMWDMKTGTRAGSLQDQVGAVAQLAYFDSTSTDVYLTSVRSRLTKLPPMIRLILKDARSEVIYGLYCGWEPPSPQTVLMAILNGCDSKVAYCERFGITITEEDWPSFLASTHQTDNGEGKAARITEAEQQFGFSVEYVQAGRGDKKGGIESQHHADHKSLDHKLSGTTHGRRHKRGEKLPVTDALWNYHEYMHELILEILEENNKEALELAPTAMLKEEPLLRPTRLNIFKWLRRKGLTAELPCNVDAMRAFLLPDHQAIIRKNGVYLMAEIHGRMQIIPKLRYSSSELVATGVLARVKLTDRAERTCIKLREDDLSSAWMATKNGMIPLKLTGSDTLLRDRMCLKDWCMWMESLTLEKDMRKGSDEQALLSKLLRIGGTTAGARAEQKAEIKERPRKPTTAEQKRGLKANRDIERILMAGEESPSPESVVVLMQCPPVQAEAASATTSASARAMRKFKQIEDARDAH